MQLLLDLPLPPLGLDDFLPGNNAALLHVLRELLSGQRRETGLYVWGVPGCGKSHLLQASVAEALARGLVAGYIDGSRQSLSERLWDHAWLALDNVDALNDDSQVELFSLYNHFQRNGGVLLVAGPLPAPSLPLRADVTTRLGWGLSFEVQPLADTNKVEALRRHAQRRGFELPREVADYVISHWPRDMHSLTVALDAIDHTSLAEHRTITLPLARRALGLGR